MAATKPGALRTSRVASGIASAAAALVCAALVLVPAASVPVAAQQPRVRGAHEIARDPKAVTDDLDLSVPGTPIDHPARVYPATDDFPTGPSVGERLPDFTLVNQHGERVAFHASRGRGKAIVSFQRSAVW